MNKFLGFDKVLCLSPHPDDVEYSISGTIQKYKDTIFKIVCMTSGGESDPTSGDLRFNEVKNFWKIFNVNNIELYFLDGPMSKYIESEWLDQITWNYLDDVDCVILPPSHDAHFEHRIVNIMGFPLTRNRNLSVIEYKTVSIGREWISNFSVNVDEHIIVKKIHSLRNSFFTQLDSRYFDEHTIKMFHHDFISHKRNIKYSESFKITQLYKG
jgi:hypothetical protein